MFLGWSPAIWQVARQLFKANGEKFSPLHDSISHEDDSFSKTITGLTVSRALFIKRWCENHNYNFFEAAL